MAGGFLFLGNAHPAQADTCTCSSYAANTPQNASAPSTTTTNTAAECNSYCSNLSANYSAFGSGNPTGTTFNTTQDATSASIAASVAPTDPDTCELMNPASWIFCLLLMILKFFSWILSAAAALFIWAADANSLTNVINGQGIYSTWGIVRDLLNMAFIMVLLYVAFCTIFQIDSYNYKKMLLTIVLMALLVNFSFPIARFIIDVGNTLMYTIFNSLFSGSDPNGILTMFSKNSGIGTIIQGTNSTSPPAQIVGATVFVAILAITFLMMAILFFIRIVALALIIIFSPIAFVGAAVPGLHSLSSKWWDYIFKYTFFGPAMAFMLYIATVIIKTTIAVSTTNTAFSSFTGGFGPDKSIIASMANFAIPIVVLWIGMNVAQKMGIEGAALAQKFATKAFKAVAMAPVKAAQYGFKKTGVTGGLQQKWANWKKTGITGSDATDERAARIAGSGPFAVKGAYEELERKKIAETRKKWKDEGGATDKTIADALNSEDKIKRKAGALEAAEKVGFGDEKHAYDNYMKAKAAVAESPALRALFDDKVKEKHIKLVIEDDIRTNKTDPATAYRKHLSDLTPDEMAKQKGLHENIGDDPNLQNYIRNEVLSDTEYHKEFFKKLSRTQRAAYMDEKVKLNPEGTFAKGPRQAPAEEQPKRNWQDVERERARNAQETINKTTI